MVMSSILKSDVKHEKNKVKPNDIVIAKKFSRFAENRIKPKLEKCSEIHVKKEVIAHPKIHIKHEEIRVKQEEIHVNYEEFHAKWEVVTEQSSENSDELVWESVVGLGVTLSESGDFKDYECIDDFKIVVEGVNINHILPSCIRLKYYDLCCTQNSYLHQNLLKGLNFNLTVGLISETVLIADGISRCRMTSGSCRRDLMNWDKSLKAFEKFGIEIGFLRERIHKLVELLTQEEMKEMTMTFKLAEKQRAETEMQNQTLFEELFAEEAKAPW